MSDNAVQHLTEATFDQAVADGIALVDFWAEWCGPCRMQAPVLDELAGEPDSNITIAKVNVDQEPSLAARFRVQGIPLLVFLRDGREVGRLVGVQSKATLVQALEQVRLMPTQP